MFRLRTFVTIALAVTAMASCGGLDAHTHDGFEIPEGEAVPTVQLSAKQDSVSGWNLQLVTTNFTFSPERAGREFVLGEGHGHLYVDGEKRDRIYGSWYHLDNLGPGEHTIEVTLNGNNHAVYQSGGRSISDEIAIEVADREHTHSAAGSLEAGPDMDIVLNVESDPVGGWNVFVSTQGFTWTPEKAGAGQVAGEGHAHLYVDDQKIARIYGPAAYLGPLDPGLHTVTVSLHGNNHDPYIRDGQPLAATVSIEEAGATGEPSKTVAIEVLDGRVVGGVQQVEVARGDTLEVIVTSDQPDTLHVHGYDVTHDLREGIETSVAVTAGIPGVFEIELEERGLLLMYLTVR